MLMHERLRHYIESNGWNINFVARKIGIKESRFYRIINGDAPLTTCEYEFICKGLDLHPSYFFNDNFLETKNEEQVI